MTKNNGNGHQLHFKIHPMSETMNGWIIYLCKRGHSSFLPTIYFVFLVLF